MGNVKSFIQWPFSATLWESESKWEVYLVKPDEMFKHHSLLFYNLTDSNTSFIVELVKERDPDSSHERYRTKPQCRQTDFSKLRYSKLNFVTLGEVSFAGKDIWNFAVDIWKNMGAYHFVLNNCQDYCKSLCKAIHCEQSYLTDTQKVAAGLGTAAAIVGGACLLYKAVSGDKKNND